MMSFAFSAIVVLTFISFYISLRKFYEAMEVRIGILFFILTVISGLLTIYYIGELLTHYFAQ